MWRARNIQLEDDEVPQVLESLDLPGVAKYMRSDACKHIFVMAGAGISTAAGIPDFRSPDTGLYANLARLKLPYPEAVFDINFFRRNPVPFYTLAHELAPGRYKPTLTHTFIRLLAEKGRLHTCFTQNIDTLERKAGVPPEKIVEAHGSFADQHCIDCGAPYPDDKMRDAIAKKEIARCERKKCRGLVKPDIVFFGENLPPRFFSTVRHLQDADLLIVMGTSLTVHPFASLPELVPNDCPRLLFNLDHVGGWGSRTNDVAALMRVDDAVRELCKLLGWEDDLANLFGEVVGDTEAAAESPGLGEKTPEIGIPGAAAETAKNVIEDLARAVESMKLKQDEAEEKVTANASTTPEGNKEKLPSKDTAPVASEDDTGVDVQAKPHSETPSDSSSPGDVSTKSSPEKLDADKPVASEDGTEVDIQAKSHSETPSDSSSPKDVSTKSSPAKLDANEPAPPDRISQL